MWRFLVILVISSKYILSAAELLICRLSVGADRVPSFRYQPVRESSRALLVVPRGALYSEKLWEALCFSLPEDATAGFINTHFNFLTACETNDKLKKKGFPKTASFGLLSQLQNASVAHLVAFYGPTLPCPHGYDEALEMKSSETSPSQKNLHRRACLKGLLLPLPCLILELCA